MLVECRETQAVQDCFIAGCSFCSRKLKEASVPFLASDKGDIFICAVCTELFLEQVYMNAAVPLSSLQPYDNEQKTVWRDAGVEAMMQAAAQVESLWDKKTLLQNLDLDEKSFQSAKLVLELASNTIRSLAWEKLRQVWQEKEKK